MNAPRPPLGTLNSCFGEYRSVWVHLASFRYYTKLGAIWAEQVKLVRKGCATWSCRTFSQRTHLVYPIVP